MSGDTVTSQVRKVLMRVVERLRSKAEAAKSDSEGWGIVGRVLTIIADEIEAEALGKKKKPTDN